MGQVAKIVNPLESIEFGIIKSNSIDLILDSLHTQAGCILGIRKILESNHEIKEILKSQGKTVYVNSLNVCVHQKKPIKKDDREIDFERVMIFLLEKIIAPEVLEKNENAVELLLYVIYYCDGRTRKKAIAVLLETGCARGRDVVLEALCNYFLLKRSPNLLQILFHVENSEPGDGQACSDRDVDLIKDSDHPLSHVASCPINKNKAIDIAARWLTVGNENQIIELIKLYHDYEVGDRNREDLLKNLEFLKKVLIGKSGCMYDFDVRIMVYEIAEKLFYSHDRYKTFVLDVFFEFAEMENTYRGADKLLKIYSNFPCVKADDLIMLILSICEKNDVYEKIEADVEKVLLDSSLKARISFYEKILISSTDAKTAYCVVGMLYKIGSVDTIMNFFEKRRVSLVGLNCSIYFYFSLKTKVYFANEFEKKIADDDLDSILELIWRIVKKTKNKENQLLQIAEIARYEEKEYTEKCINFLLFIAEKQKFFAFAICQLLIIRLNQNTLVEKVDKALIALKSRNAKKFEKILFDYLVRGIIIEGESLYRSSAGFLGDKTCTWSRELLKKVLNGKVDEEVLMYCILALSVKAVRGDDKALKIIIGKDFTTRFWIISASLTEIYLRCHERQIKTMLIQGSLVRMERAVLTNARSNNMMSMKSEFSLVNACFSDYGKGDKKQLLRVIAKMPYAKEINGSMKVVLEELVVLFEKKQKNELIRFFQKMVIDCQSFDFEGFNGYSRNQRKEELTYLLGLVEAHLLDLY